MGGLRVTNDDHRGRFDFFTDTADPRVIKTASIYPKRCFSDRVGYALLLTAMAIIAMKTWSSPWESQSHRHAGIKRE